MQSLAMDGVRRTSAPGARPQALVLAQPKKRPAPLDQNQTFGRVTLDGMRRNIPTPREMIEMTQSVPPMVIPQVLPPERSYSRPMIGFSIVASALIVAAVSGTRLLPARAASNSELLSRVTSTSTSASSAKSTAPGPSPVAASALASSQASTSLQALLDAFVAAHGSQYTLYVKDLKTGSNASINADRTMLSASLYKLFVAQRVFQKVDDGSLNYGQTAGSESGRTIENCLTVMINISDNACGHDLGELLGWSKQDNSLKTSGFSSTTLGGGNTPQTTNAKDVGLLLEHLYSGTLMSPNATNRFMNLLKDQRVNDRFPVGLPAGTVIAHKTGDLSGYTHDAGIVYGKNTDFLIVAMSGPWTSPENSKAAFGTLAGQLNTYFNN
jgi:beta-lactamase class A